jgi:tRNA isopentenyl-2-thiomethyl-A-37 hydroxylase MiaE
MYRLSVKTRWRYDIENVSVSASKYSESQRTAASTREPKALQSGTSSTSVNITEPNEAAWHERSQGFEPLNSSMALIR